MDLSKLEYLGKGVADVKKKLEEYEDKVAVGAFKITGIDDRGSTVSVR